MEHFLNEEYGHVQADQLAAVVQHALSLNDLLEREVVLTRDRKAVLHSIATLIDDIPGFKRTDGDQLLVALADRQNWPAGYTESRLILAGKDVMDCYESRDWENFFSRLHDLDELSIEQLKIVRPESVMGNPKPRRRT